MHINYSIYTIISSMKIALKISIVCNHQYFLISQVSITSACRRKKSPASTSIPTPRIYVMLIFDIFARSYGCGIALMHTCRRLLTAPQKVNSDINHSHLHLPFYNCTYNISSRTRTRCIYIESVCTYIIRVIATYGPFPRSLQRGPEIGEPILPYYPQRSCTYLYFA